MFVAETEQSRIRSETGQTMECPHGGNGDKWKIIAIDSRSRGATITKEKNWPETRAPHPEPTCPHYRASQSLRLPRESREAVLLRNDFESWIGTISDWGRGHGQSDTGISVSLRGPGAGFVQG